MVNAVYPAELATGSKFVRSLIVPLSLVSCLLGPSADELSAQRPRVSGRNTAACQCSPEGRPRRPRFLLPVAGGIGFLPIALAARDSQLPTLDFPGLVDIRDTSPRNAIEGERQLALGAVAPDTATTLPTLMLFAGMLTLFGIYLTVPRSSRWRWVRRRAKRGQWRLRTVYRRRGGYAVTAAGGLLLLLGSREYAEGAQAQRRARVAWFKEASHSSISAATAGAPRASDSAVQLPGAGVETAELVRGAPVARLVIPAIGLDEIVVEGVGPLELNAGPGHYPGSALPGDRGNAIVSAHRDRHFRRLGEMEIGTRIRTETRFGTVEWVVSERRIVARDTPALFREPEATLTLTTCWPLRYFGPAPDRLIVVAKPARVSARAGVESRGSFD